MCYQGVNNVLISWIIGNFPIFLTRKEFETFELEMRIYLDTYIVKKISHFTNKLSTFVLMVARLTIVALKFFQL